MKEKIFSILFFITLTVFMTPHINCDDLNLELETKTIDTGWVNLGKCIIHLKNKNKLTGKVRMRFNYPVYGKNYSKGYFFIQSGYDKNKIALKKVKIIRLDHIKYPFKGKIMLTTFSEKEYPLKHYIVSRAPIQFIGPTKGILSLRFRVIEKIELTR